jgi:hypothetical protein
MDDASAWSATKIFDWLVSGDRHRMDTAMAALVTLGDAVDRRTLRNLIRDRLQGGPPEDAASPVTARLLTALARISEDELEAMVRANALDRQEVSRRLSVEVGGGAAFERLRARAAATEQYAAAVGEAEGRIRQLFEAVVRQARVGALLWTGVDLVVFALGALLLAGGAAAVLVGAGAAGPGAAAAVGGVGALCVLYALLAGRARHQVSDAAASSVRLQVIFLAYLRQLRQIDEAYARRLLDEAEISANEVREFQQLVHATMNGALQEVGSPAAVAASRLPAGGPEAATGAAPPAGRRG